MMRGGGVGGGGGFGAQRMMAMSAGAAPPLGGSSRRGRAPQENSLRAASSAMEVRSIRMFSFGQVDKAHFGTFGLIFGDAGGFLLGRICPCCI